MSGDARDPLIKLFGADIHFPSSHHLDHPSLPPDECMPRRIESDVDDSSNARHGGESMGSVPISGDSMSLVRSVEENQCDKGSQEKVLKRPDKLIPCPRCKSLNTKFCYFNNYNVNQPRHFCKNCHRYWTAGGTIRNVPVGAGKRKNKQLPLLYNQDTTSEGTVQADSPIASSSLVQSNISLSTSLDGNDNSRKLGKNPLCESMVSMFCQNGVELVSNRAAEEPSSSISSISPTTLNELELPAKEASEIKSPEFYYGSTASIPLPYCVNSQWYPWVPVAGLMQPGEKIKTGAVLVKDAPVIYTSAMNFPVIPYYGSMPVFSGSALTVPLTGYNEHISPLGATDSSCSNTSSLNLGKHSRETNVSAEEKTEKCLWVPKSKKIDSMDTASKCSILNSLGLKPGKSEPLIKGGVFKAFRSNIEGSKNPTEVTDPSLKSNPVALSRSQSFQEST